MKKSVIIFTVLLSILSFSSCGTQSGKPAEVEVNTPKNEASNTEPSAVPVTSEPDTAPSRPSEVTSKVVNNCGDCALQDDRIYYSNSYDNGTLYSINTDGSDNRKLNDDWTSWFYVSGDRIYYQNGKDGKIYAMNTDGSGQQKLNEDDSRNVDLRSGVYKDVTYEISASLREDMSKYRFMATGVTRGADEWVTGYIMGLEVFDESGLSLLTVDFSQTVHDLVVGNDVYNIMMDTMGLHVTDVNFDGYKDVIILNSFGGAHANTWYDGWLWNPEASSFAKAESFTDICNPALDPEKKCIYSTGGSGAGNRGWTIYQFIDGGVQGYEQFVL